MLARLLIILIFINLKIKSKMYLYQSYWINTWIPLDVIISCSQPCIVLYMLREYTYRKCEIKSYRAYYVISIPSFRSTSQEGREMFVKHICIYRMVVYMGMGTRRKASTRHWLAQTIPNLFSSIPFSFPLLRRFTQLCTESR